MSLVGCALTLPVAPPAGKFSHSLGMSKHDRLTGKIVFYRFMDKNCSHQGERRNELPEQKTTADCFNRAGNHSNNHHSR